MPEVAAARANYESAQAQARQAAADAKRYENLVATGDVSRSAYEKARTPAGDRRGAGQRRPPAVRGRAQRARARAGARSRIRRPRSKASRAQLAQAEKALADTTIRAPFDGFITARPVAAGEYVALTNKIATIVTHRHAEAQLQTPEQRAAAGAHRA